MTRQYTIQMAGGVARNPLVRLAKPVDLAIAADEHIAIVGPNGAGKSLLVDMLTGKYPLRDGSLAYDFSPSPTATVYDNIKYIAFRDTYGSADANYYYQQRWNAHDQEEVPTVRELLGKVPDKLDGQAKRTLFDMFRLEPLLDKKIILLSSGELRKFQLAKSLLTSPRVLIMDNPFIGLDAATRASLGELLEQLAGTGKLQIILVLSMLDDVPPFITHVVPVADKVVGPKGGAEGRTPDLPGHFPRTRQGQSLDKPAAKHCGAALHAHQLYFGRGGKAEPREHPLRRPHHLERLGLDGDAWRQVGIERRKRGRQVHLAELSMCR